MDPKVTDLTKELINSISLQLWSINLLLDGGIDEGHFGGKFKSYKDRFERCMASRNEIHHQLYLGVPGDIGPA